MSIGDKITLDGVEFEIVWAGGEGLISDRETKAIDTWSPPANRKYTKTGMYAKKKQIDNVVSIEQET